MSGGPVRSLSERFWKFVKKTGADECWLWAGCINNTGYGVIGVGCKSTLAHRVSFELHYGPIPPGEGAHGTCVCHTCDVRSCVNPSHLWLGTQFQNVADRVAKGRSMSVQGDDHGAAKLTSSDVREIRGKYATGTTTQVELAEEFGVTQGSISKIILRKNWRFVL